MPRAGYASWHCTKGTSMKAKLLLLSSLVLATSCNHDESQSERTSVNATSSGEDEVLSDDSFGVLRGEDAPKDDAVVKLVGSGQSCSGILLCPNGTTQAILTAAHCTGMTKFTNY